MDDDLQSRLEEANSATEPTDGMSYLTRMTIEPHIDNHGENSNPKKRQVQIVFNSSDGAPEDLIDSCFKLFERNMRGMYEESSWGFDRDAKMDELRHPNARFLTAFGEEGVAGGGRPLLGFSHFRFERDNEDDTFDPILYVYEIHVSDAARRSGLGKRLMTIMELIAVRYKLRRVVLTVFKSNISAMQFYLNKMKYGVDHSSPSKYGEETDYEILSKVVCKK